MLRITEIFHSLQGETSFSGWPTVFIRLTGCPLRCQYCDTAYAFSGGKKYSFDEILAEVKSHGAKFVTLTGGEPLAQPNAIPLLEKLCDAGYQVSLETSGAMDISKVDSRVARILDIKTPGSMEVKKNLWENIPLLTVKDEVKFVICNRGDFDWAVEILNQYKLPEICDVLFSPSAEELAASELADWILEAKLPVRFQIQLHKVLGVA